MASERVRRFAGDLVLLVAALAVLWGAVLPGLAMVLQGAVVTVIFLFVALTIVGIAGLVHRALQRAASPQRVLKRAMRPEAQRAFTALARLEASLDEVELPDLALQDAQRALAELVAEAKLDAEIVAICDRELDVLGTHEGLDARRAAATHHLLEIGSAADEFVRDLDGSQVGSDHGDPVERLQAARRALKATVRELG